MGRITIFLGICFILEGQLNLVAGSSCYYTSYYSGNTIYVRTCPGSSDCSDETYCCGSGSLQYCCDSSGSSYSSSSCSYYYYYTYSYVEVNWGAVIGGSVVGFLVLGACVAGGIALCVNASKRGGVTHFRPNQVTTMTVQQQGGMAMTPQQGGMGTAQYPSSSTGPAPIRPPPYHQPVQQQFTKGQQPHPFTINAPNQQYPPPPPSLANPAYPPPPTAAAAATGAGAATTTTAIGQ